MKVSLIKRPALMVGLVVSITFLIVTVSPSRFVAPAGAQQSTSIAPAIPMPAPGSVYRQTNLVSDIPGFAPVLDPLLVNPWGISMTASSPFWVANNGTNTSQLIRGDVSGAPVVLNASMPTVTIPGSPGLPTGTVANPSATDFVLPGPCASPPCVARFLFASITGNITGWNPNAPAAGSTTAVIAASHAAHVYTGLAIGSNSGGNRLYAADFRNNHIDVFNGTFADTTVSGGFVDPTIPAGFSVFNIQNLGGSLYVTYAKTAGTFVQNSDGFGLVRKFDTDGVRVLSFGIDNGPLSAVDAPWGLVIAPSSFGIFGGALLVGNFSTATNSKINAYNPSTGVALVAGVDNSLKNEAGQSISIEGLWSLTFGNGGAGGDPSTLYFTAGTAAEEHGLFGKLNPTTATATSLIQFASDTFAIGEGSGHIDISVTRGGDASGTATVNVNTYDASQPGHASQKSDYEIALAKVTFNPGETSKTVRILLVNDLFVEGNEVLNLALSNPAGAGVGLGSPNQATLTITDNDSVAPTTNPIDDTSFFVRQQYLDFLNREPDASGFAFWTNNITGCSPTPCTEVSRINTSAAFFLSIEFQTTGALAYNANRAAFGSSASGSPAAVLYGQFEKDVQQLQQNLVFGQPGFDAQLEANKVAYFNDFVNRPEFVTKYPSTLTNDQFVDNLLTSANMSTTDFTVNLTNSQEVPPTNPTLTGGARRDNSYGTARFTFGAGDTTLTMNATVNNIDVTGSQTADANDNLVAAHIHAGASVAPGVNGPVVWGFFGTPFNDNNPDDHVVTPFGSGVGGNFSDKWDAPEGNGTTLAAQVANIRAGRAYVNFHTTQFGGGEIRGNFPATQAFRDSLVSGLNGATLTRAGVLRMVAESQFLQAREFNSAFVTMEYFGYLRRDPDTAGFNFWLGKLNNFGGSFIQSEMVKAFLNSSEYRQRFGP